MNELPIYSRKCDEELASLRAERDALRARVEKLEIEREAQRSCAIYWMDQENALRASIAALAEKWMEQQAAYPNSEEGKHAAAAVRLCATELRQLGEGNSAAAQEGL